MSIANTTDTTLQGLLNLSQQAKTNKANFAEFFETDFSQSANFAKSAETTMFSASSAQMQWTNAHTEFDKMMAFPFYGLINASKGWEFFMSWTASTTTSVSVSNLLNESDSDLPLQAFLASELSDIDRTQLEAISKDVLKTELQADDGFKTIFFRDAQSFEFVQNTLSEANIQALKDEFGEDSFLEREDGSLVLTGKAEKFVSGWQKALDEVNSNEISLDTLITKDADLNGTLDNSELGSVSQSTITITQETLFIVTTIFIVYGVALKGDLESLLADFHALAKGFAFENLSTTSKLWLQENFSQFFSEKADENSNADDEKSASDESGVNDENSANTQTSTTKEFDRAKFDAFYANFKSGFNFVSASFMGLKGYQANSLNFERLSAVASNLASNFTNNAQKA